MSPSRAGPPPSAPADGDTELYGGDELPVDQPDPPSPAGGSSEGITVAADRDAATPAGDGLRLEPGTEVDHFRVRRPLGRGGMGQVYLARDTQLGRKVALKFLLPQRVGSPESVERLVDEARTTARFNHPHILTVYAVGEYAGYPYLALEFLEGQNLRERMAEERLATAQAVRYGLAIAEALAEAHRNGIEHRDLKPENVMIPADGRPRVVDFGLAREVDDARAEVADAPAGADGDPPRSRRHGTPAYMAPELWREERSGSAADLWAFGLILYEMVVGRYPFRGGSVQQLVGAILYSRPAAVPDDVPAELSGLIEGCLDADPGARPTAEAAAETLAALLGRGSAMRGGERAPFRGLLPWDERDADWFFGRDREIDAFLEKARHEAVLPVIGASGAGKSSFVRAGVIPRLREQGAWVVIQLRPGREPLRALAARVLATDEQRSRVSALLASRAADASFDGDLPSSLTSNEVLAQEALEQDLAAALAASPALLALQLLQVAEQRDARVLLYVDQLEELFTQAADAEAARAFLDAVCGAADDPGDPVRVVFTLRDDFLVRAAASPLARDVLGRVTVIRTPDATALDAIVSQPVAAAGYRFEDPGLPAEMVRQVAGERVPLPLLQVAGQLLWERRDPRRRLLTRAAYDELGGVAGALARHADGVLEGLTPTQLQLTRALLLRLVSPDGTRRMLARDVLIDGLDEGADEVVDRLIQGRLVLVRKGPGRRRREGGELELVHESLARSWARLARWIDESREELAFVHEVRQAAELWERRGRRDDEVWTGDALHDAVRRAQRFGFAPSEVTAFLAAGKQREQRRERARRRRIMAGFASLAVALLVVGVVALEALRQRGAAVEGQRLAESRQADALRQAASRAMAQGDPFDARLQIRAALEAADSPMARAFWWQLRDEPLQWRTRVPGGSLGALAISPDGSRVAAGGWSACVFDRETRRRHVLRGRATSSIMSAEFFPDGERVVFDHEIWDLTRDQTRLLPPHGPDWQISRVSPDGRYVTTTGNDALVKVWDPLDGTLVATIEGADSRDYCGDGSRAVVLHTDDTVRVYETDGWTAVATHPIGATLGSSFRRVKCLGHDHALVFGDGPARWMSLTTGQVDPLRHADAELNFAMGSPDGRRLATVFADGAVVVWEVADRSSRVLGRHEGPARSIWWSSDATRLATWGQDRVARVWDVERGEPLGVFQAEEYALSEDGRWLATSSGDGVIALWALDRGAREAVTAPHAGGIYDVAVSADGAWIATAGTDGTARIWDTSDGSIARVLHAGERPVRALRFAPDGATLWTAGRDGRLRGWSLGEERAALTVDLPVGDRLYGVALSPDGSRIATTSERPTVQLWDTDSGALIETLTIDGRHTSAVAFSPDGRWLVASDRDGAIHVWDRRGGLARRTLRAHTHWVWGVAIAPDGHTLASASLDGTVRLWDLRDGSSRLLIDLGARAYAVSFDPSGERLAVACADGLVRVVDRGGEVQLALPGHVGEVNSVVFAGERGLASVSDDATVRLWDGGTGAPRWRGVALLGDPPAACTHRGWRDPDGLATDDPPAWREAIARHALDASLSADGRLACVVTVDARVELWDPAADQRLATVPLAGARRAVPVGGRCAVLAGDGAVRWVDRDGASSAGPDGATALAVCADGLLVAAGRSVTLFGDDGEADWSVSTEGPATALAATDDTLYVGFAEGDLQAVARPDAVVAPARVTRGLQLDDPPYSAVTGLLPEPDGLLVVGHANGALVLWSRDGGAALRREALHGPVHRLRIADRQLHVLTELGDTRSLDLSVFYRERCELLREVWAAVPMRWSAGEAVEAPPPPGHLCAP